MIVSADQPPAPPPSSSLLLADSSLSNLDNLDTGDLATSSTSSFKTIDNNLSDSSTCSSELLNTSLNSSSNNKMMQMDDATAMMMKDDCADLNQILNETLELTKLLTIKGAEMDAAAAAQSGPVALAEAEVDEDDVVGAAVVTGSQLDSETNAAERQQTAVVSEEDEEGEEETAGPVRIEKIINEINKRNSVYSVAAAAAPPLLSQQQKAPTATVVLSPEERISNEAKEYWATIDLYNNSKLAFNKRCKSVKQKREKLNAEWEQRQKLMTSTLPLPLQQPPVMAAVSGELDSSDPATAAVVKMPEICTCVKCSIVYHEALIRGITDVNAIICNKCNNKLIYCRCCSAANGGAASLSVAATLADSSSSSAGRSCCPSSDASSISTSSSNISSSRSNNSSNSECTQLDDKIFSIKNELVSLSETSLDVFQLLLQLSDTMLELNTQINNSSSVNSYSSANQQHMLAFSNFLESTGLSSHNQFPPLIDSTNSTHNLSLVNEEEAAAAAAAGYHPQQVEDDGGHFYVNSSSSSMSMASKIRSVIDTCTSAASSATRPSPLDEHYQQPLKIANPAYFHRPGPVDPGPMSPRTANSITSIINSLNKKAETTTVKSVEAAVTSGGGQLSTPVSAKMASRRLSTTPGDEIELAKACSSFKKPSRPSHPPPPVSQSPLPSPSPSSCSSSAKQLTIENLYDKTSVTQFVDNLLNHSSNCTAAPSSSSTTECCTIDDYSIDDSSLASSNKVVTAGSGGIGGQSPLTTQMLMAKQHSSSLINSKLNEYNMMGGSFRKGTSPAMSGVLPVAATGQVVSSSSSAKSCVGTTMKSSSSSTSSSSSSGCGGSSSLCFSSNVDLTSLPSSASSSTNIVDTTEASSATMTSKAAGTAVSRRSLSSVKSAAETCSSSTGSSEHQSYRHSTVSNTVSSSSHGQSDQSTTPQPSSSSSSSCSTTSAFEMVNNLLDSVSSFDEQNSSDSTSNSNSKSNTLPKDKSPARPVSSTQAQPRSVHHQVLYKPAVSANMPSHRSNSVNYKNNQVVVAAASTNHHHLANVVLTHDASLQAANRKPSFKFESSILNRVQTMNLNKIKCLNSKQPLLLDKAPTQPVTTATSCLDQADEASESTAVHQQPIIKQSAGESTATTSVDRATNVKRKHSINRQPIIAMPTSSSLLKVQHSDLTTSAAKHLTRAAASESSPDESRTTNNLPSISLVH